MKPMRPNPGGQLDPNDIVGRDGIVRDIWRILEGRSVYMNDLRRIGKTQILSRMESMAPDGWLCIRRDLGGFHSAEEFATWTFRDAHERLGRAQRAFRRMEQLVGALKGTEIAGVLKLGNGAPAPWKEVLRRTFSDLQDALNETKKYLVFLWDEVPFLIGNIGRLQGSNTSMEILDVLRTESQSHSRIRFVLTGSVGLHHILAELRIDGYVGSPLNHMERIAPGALSSEHAQELAEALLMGASLTCSNSKACAVAICEATGNVAFYIHKIVARLPRNLDISPSEIESTVAREIAHPDNDWDFAHYRNRVPLYYGEDERVVLAILDTIASADTPATLDDIRRGVAAILTFDDREKLLGLLKLLQQDHYLSRDLDGRYAFRLPLIRRWWRFDRGLEGRTS